MSSASRKKSSPSNRRAPPVAAPVQDQQAIAALRRAGAVPATPQPRSPVNRARARPECQRPTTQRRCPSCCNPPFRRVAGYTVQLSAVAASPTGHSQRTGDVDDVLHRPQGLGHRATDAAALTTPVPNRVREVDPGVEARQAVLLGRCRDATRAARPGTSSKSPASCVRARSTSQRRRTGCCTASPFSTRKIPLWCRSSGIAIPLIATCSIAPRGWLTSSILPSRAHVRRGALCSLSRAARSSEPKSPASPC